MNLLKYSEFFKFETEREFSYGLIIKNNEIILSYSTNNSTSKIGIYDYDYIVNNLIWFIQ